MPDSRITIWSPAEWSTVSEEAHRAVFGREKSASRDRIDYVLVAIVDEKPLGYIMAREVDEGEVYWQFGGAFAWARNSIRIGSILDDMIATQTKIGVRRIGFRVEADNFPMLKLALSRRFQIVGTRNHNGKTLVEWVKEFR